MEKIKNRCLALITLLGPQSRWEFDDRFNTTLICLENAFAEQHKNDILDLFDERYDRFSIKKAPDIVRSFAQSFNGIQDGQLLLIASEGKHALFGAWWPWGDGSKVSLRIGFLSLLTR